MMGCSAAACIPPWDARGPLQKGVSRTLLYLQSALRSPVVILLARSNSHALPSFSPQNSKNITISKRAARKFKRRVAELTV